MRLRGIAWVFSPILLVACSGVAPTDLFSPSPDGGAEGGAQGDQDSGAAGDSGGDSGGSCSPLSCFLGCCHGATCVRPNSDSACGVFGAACQDCTSLGQTCQAGSCK